MEDVELRHAFAQINERFEQNDQLMRELMRDIWKQMVAMDKSLNGKIDALGSKIDAKGEALDTKIEALDTKLSGRIDQLTLRMQRNFDRLDLRLVVIDGKVDDLDARLVRVEEHVGLHPTPR